MDEYNEEIGYWGDCINTFDEEQKHYVYADRMQLPKERYYFNLHSASVLDVGGGPVSMLLKCCNRGRSKVIDPLVMHWPEWVRQRYIVAGIEFESITGEAMTEQGWDEVWLYNCMQHVQDPEKLLRKCLQAGKTLRVFEWIDFPLYGAHHHTLTQEFFERILGKGMASDFSEQGCFGRAFYGVFKAPVA